MAMTRAALDAELFLTTAELAERWRISVHTINGWRARSEGPAWVKLETGTVLYRASVILEWETSGARGLTLPRVIESIQAFTGLDATTKAALAEHVRSALTAS